MALRLGGFYRPKSTEQNSVSGETFTDQYLARDRTAERLLRTVWHYGRLTASLGRK